MKVFRAWRLTAATRILHALTCDDVPLNIDKPDEIILTAPYFTDEIAHVRKKK